MGVPKEIYELIKNSGNNFHAKVARWFADNEWHVIVSPYYMDQTQEKAREIDLVVEKLFPVRNMFRNLAGHVAARLFIECKYVPMPSVFWFARKDRESALKAVCAQRPFYPENQYTQRHHYLAHSPRVAKLFATSRGRASENDPLYRALNQVLNAMVSMRDSPISLVASNRSHIKLLGRLQFPVVLCNSFDKFYSVEFFTESDPNPVEENFQLELMYAFIDRHGNQRNEYFLVDFVQFDQIEKFLSFIEEDLKAASHLAAPS